MKKIFAIMAIVAIGFTSCKKDDDNGSGSGSAGGGSLTVEQKNRGLLIDFSETWCPPCGAYGGPGFDSCLTMEGSKITAIKVYGSSTPSSLNSSISNGFAGAYGVSGVPDFWLNNAELNPGGGVYSSTASNFNWVNNKANAFAAEPVVAGIALKKEVVGDSIKVTTKVKFYAAQPAGTDYKIAVYIVEKDIVATQQVSGSPAQTGYKHHNLVRAANAPSYSGVSLNTSAAITADQEFSNTFMIAKGATWNVAKLKAVGVIWKGGSNPLKVVNSNVAL
jgi:hypothetical protein